MRIFYWLLGAAATFAGAAYLSRLRSEKRIIGLFLDALETGRVTVTSDPDWKISGNGEREKAYYGVADGVDFAFTARTDARQRWMFTLTWVHDPVIEHWHLGYGKSMHSLRVIYETLKRLAIRDKRSP